MMIFYAIGIMVVLAGVSWVHYRYTGGGWKNAGEPLMDGAFGDGTDNGAGSLPPGHEVACDDGDD